ncbi:hypothetical protein [Alkalihalobacillus sp. TS-13]|uniref:hypothetical protein n=1 Tax=Alkalihalobacillus sp. TS-13 TaxID=2842455 RepID=UPI001C879B67|nr:hypothetical protein [Alkalihalobacillus sp. TS-13]
MMVSVSIQKQFADMLVTEINSGTITRSGARILFKTAYQMETVEFRAVAVSPFTQAAFARMLAKGMKRRSITRQRAVELYRSAYGKEKIPFVSVLLAIDIEIGNLNEYGWNYAP